MNQGKSVAVQPVRPVLNFSALQRDVIRMVAFVAMVGDHDSYCLSAGYRPY
ncbi:type-F conjugative transfer system pilin acetylase TraX domain protein [Escherichia coli DEC7C]|uniref:hypothetical protein n=1 Tax=Escherichia coli TaxID=562 RepID=UPI0002514A23|nr:type-F conjugative transfer system pilin acetylase TraX domain protein [Escherichia coli DEC7C]